MTHFWFSFSWLTQYKQCSVGYCRLCTSQKKAVNSPEIIFLSQFHNSQKCFWCLRWKPCSTCNVKQANYLKYYTLVIFSFLRKWFSLSLTDLDSPFLFHHLHYSKKNSHRLNVFYKNAGGSISPKQLPTAENGHSSWNQYIYFTLSFAYFYLICDFLLSQTAFAIH